MQVSFAPGSFYDRIILFRALYHDVTVLSWYEPHHILDNIILGHYHVQLMSCNRQFAFKPKSLPIYVRWF